MVCTDVFIRDLCEHFGSLLRSWLSYSQWFARWQVWNKHIAIMGEQLSSQIKFVTNRSVKFFLNRPQLFFCIECKRKQSSQRGRPTRSKQRLKRTRIETVALKFFGLELRFEQKQRNKISFPRKCKKKLSKFFSSKMKKDNWTFFQDSIFSSKLRNGVVWIVTTNFFTFLLFDSYTD